MYIITKKKERKKTFLSLLINENMLNTVWQVPGVEADDVIGTMAVNSVSTGFKVIFLNLYFPSIILDTI